MAERDYSGALPTAPPEGVLPWLLEQGFLSENLLIYKAGWYYEPLTDRKVQAVKLTCTGCGESVYADKVDGSAHAAYALAPFGFIHPNTREILRTNQNCLCPSCGAEVTVKHITGVTESLTCQDCYPLTVTRFEDKLALIGWCFRKWFQKDGTSGITCWPYEAYVVEKKGIVRLNAYAKFMSNLSLSGKWKQLKRFHDNWGKADLIYPWDPDILIGSTAENSKLDRLLQAASNKATYPLTYLREWQKHPNIENLVMQGAAELIMEALETGRDYLYTQSKPKTPDLSWVNWKQKSPSKMLGMTKDEYKNCLDEKWDTFTLKFWQEEKKAGRLLSGEDMKLVRSFTAIRCIEVRNTEGLDYLKVAAYLKKQQKKDNRCDFRILRDYWHTARNLGLDLSLRDVRFPPRLMAAHDRVDEMRKWRDQAKRAAEQAKRKGLFEARYEQLLPLSWELDGIMIRPVREESELTREGAKLHHCVGSYAGKHARGETAIFLIRRTVAPEEPWYTLELDEKKLEVRQNRGSRNCARTEEVTAFELRWLAWCREQRAMEQKKRPGKTTAATHHQAAV